MTFPQFIVTYSVCWWLVLFMVLPHGVQPEQKPAPGTVPSAPANPRLRRKFGITTLIAFLPAAVIYFIATTARAEDTIYHVGSDCKPLETYTMPDEISTKDGYGVGGKKVAPANLHESTILGDLDTVNIPLEVPSGKYLNADTHNVDLAESNIRLGQIQVSKDGSGLLNGQPIAPQSTYSKDCAKR